MDVAKVRALAASYEPKMVAFLRDMIRIPSESTQEGEVVERIRREMEQVGFDEVKVDGMGNVLGRVGSGPVQIAMDAHIDTVGTGARSEWTHDPYEGKLVDGVIWGRGASDQEAGMASMVYGAKILKDLGALDGFSLWIVGSVQEEDCDGLCWQYIVAEGVLKPECVVITEPTNLQVYRGHRGRMEIAVRTFGVSCHGSAPERGKNAVFMMGRVLAEIEALPERLADHPFLGKGSVTVSYIDCQTPSLCAVPNQAYIHLDRRLTLGETRETAVAEVEDAVRRAGLKEGEFEVEVLRYDTPSYTGLVYPTDKYYPTWMLEEGHPLLEASLETSASLFGTRPEAGKWVFSTNGVATMGHHAIPTVGFGPANEIHAHTVDDQVPVRDLTAAAAWYALFPEQYMSARS